jgi:L-alanine-DL-glutamate epimerase-like enolase superfamily enzyme
MLRRDFLKSAPLALMLLSPLARAATAGVRAKITDVRMRKIRVLKEVGSLMPSECMVVCASQGTPRPFTIGGESLVEIVTDQGISGFGPGRGPVTPAMISGLKQILVGKDATNPHALAFELYGRLGGAGAEIAVWDAFGKLAGMPLYKIWGGAKNKVWPYASQTTLGTLQDRPRMAATVKAAGWRGIKFRSHFLTMKEDVAAMELTRKAVGDDFILMSDANQAGNFPDSHGSGLRWDLRRAIETAKEFQRLNVYWLEEPLARFDYDGLAELNRQVDMPIAGGEFNHGIHEYREYVEHKCYDVLQTEIVQEGPAVALQVAELARMHHKQFVPHEGFMGLGTICSIHMVCAMPHAPTAEIKHEPPINDIFAQWSVFENPLALDKDGYITLSDAPGLGMTYKSDLFET